MTSAKPRPPLIPGETRICPVLPLRDIVVFPHMIAPLFIGRKKSILALEEVVRGLIGTQTRRLAAVPVVPGDEQGEMHLERDRARRDSTCGKRQCRPPAARA